MFGAVVSISLPVVLSYLGPQCVRYRRVHKHFELIIMTDSPSARSRKKARTRTANAVAFVTAILGDLAPSSRPGDLIHGVMKKVPDPYSGVSRNIIIRESDHHFWTLLLEQLEQVNGRKRVAAVGTPGVGKSTTAAYAIRCLLQAGKTVVYLHRTVDGSGYYVQFSPPEDEEGQVEIELIAESTSPSDIDSLSDPDTYYVVDPGKTKTSCDPPHLVTCRVIIVASPDERHWGESNFTKNDQAGLGGFILYFPSWSLAQLSAASTELSGVQFVNNTVQELYEVFGGVPRNVFFPEEKEKEMNNLTTKVEAMTSTQLKELVSGQLNRHSGFGTDQPKGGIVDFVATDNFSQAELRLASSTILQMVRKQLMASIWTEMATYPSPITWQLLEDYMFCALQSANNYTTRRCIGKEDAAYTNFALLELGGCTDTMLAADCTGAVSRENDLTLIHSSDRFHPLYDMIYKSGNTYYAFQLTVGKSHDAKARQIIDLVRQLHIGVGGRRLILFYAVHEGVFDDFVTKPVAPTMSNGVSIFHLKLEKGLV